MKKICTIITTIMLFVFFYSIHVFADDNIVWIDETFSTDLTYILRDEIRDRIYLADNGNNHLVVIWPFSHARLTGMVFFDPGNKWPSADCTTGIAYLRKVVQTG